jgi:hypothetical protein
VPLDGPARELPYGSASDVSISPEGAVLVGTSLYREPAYWKRYGGGTGGKIWYSPDGTTYEKILGEVSNHLVNPMWVAGRVAFMSDHEGAAAVYSALPDGSDVRRHTELGEYYARHATTDGTRVVYQQAGDLWLLESLDAGAEPVKLDVRLGGVRSGRAPFPVSAKTFLGDFGLCKTGRIVVAEVRGTAHWLPVEQGPARALLDRPGVRARIPLILPGTSTVVCVSDADGEDGLDIIPADGGETRRILGGELGRVLELAASPDAKTLAVACDDGRLLTVDVESGAATEISRSANDEPTGLTFSPDSALLAWTEGWLPEAGRGTSASRGWPTGRSWTSPRPLQRLLPRVHARRQVPGVPVEPHLRPGVRRPRVRPRIPARRPAVPGHPRRGHALALRPRAQRPPGQARGQGQDKTRARRRARTARTTRRRTPSSRCAWTSRAWPARVVPFPVQAGNYGSLRAADGALLWLDCRAPASSARA